MSQAQERTYRHVVQLVAATTPNVVIKPIVFSHNPHALVRIVHRSEIVILIRILQHPELNLDVLIRLTTFLKGKDPFLSLLEQLAENEVSRGGPSELDFFLSGQSG